MTDLMPEKIDLATARLSDEKLAQLRQLFPEAFTEGNIDFDALRRSLGEAVETSPKEERFGLRWPGKGTLQQVINGPSVGTLIPQPEESVDWDTTQNLIIEGDNLEVLKLLQKSYAGQVKMIYIDPPYNTGNDFVYPDNFTEGLQTYLEFTGQVDGNGRKMQSNTETTGRYHANWLNMMYPRLFLARNLLQEDGVVFISIDDNEVHNLRSLMNEVFGEENYVETFSWIRTSTPAALSGKTKKTVEYVIGFERNRNGSRYLGVEKEVQSSNPLLNQPNRVSELEFPAGVVTTGIEDGRLEAGNYGSDNYSVELIHSVLISDGRFVTPLRLRARFRWSQAYLADQLAEGVRVHIATRKLLPSYEKDSYGREALPNLIDSRVNVGTNEHASTELRGLFPGLDRNSFDKMHPKPASLTKYLLAAVTQAGDTVLDFFAGSGTIGHAVMQQNAEDGGNRRYIMVQLPEPLDEPKTLDDGTRLTTIADICRERVRRAGRKVREESKSRTAAAGDSHASLGTGSSTALRMTDEAAGVTPLDTGFRAYTLAPSNFRPWDGSIANDSGPQQLRMTPTSITEQLQLAADHIRPGVTDDALLAELLLRIGFDVTTPIVSEQLAGKAVYNVEAGTVLICLDRQVTLEVIEAMAARTPGRM